MLDATVAEKIGQRLDHNKADHAKGGEAGEKAQSNQCGESKLGDCAACDDGPMKDRELRDVISHSFHRLGEYLRIGAHRRAEKAEEAIAKLGQARGDEVVQKHSCKGEPCEEWNSASGHM